MDRHGGLAMTRLAGSVMSGTDAWSREARRVQELATRLGRALDEEELALQDVRDLQALHARTLRRTALHTGKEDTMSLQGYGVKEGYDEPVVAHQAGTRWGIAAKHIARQVGAGRLPKVWRTRRRSIKPAPVGVSHKETPTRFAPGWEMAASEPSRWNSAPHPCHDCGGLVARQTGYRFYVDEGPQVLCVACYQVRLMAATGGRTHDLAAQVAG